MVESRAQPLGWLGGSGPPNIWRDHPNFFHEECDYHYVTDYSARNCVYHPYFVLYNNLDHGIGPPNFENMVAPLDWIRGWPLVLETWKRQGIRGGLWKSHGIGGKSGKGRRNLWILENCICRSSVLEGGRCYYWHLIKCDIAIALLSQTAKTGLILRNVPFVWSVNNRCGLQIFAVWEMVTL